MTEEEYMRVSNEISEYIQEPQKKQLVVVEFHNTIFSKVGCKKAFFGRPYSNRLMSYLSEHFEVMLWSDCLGNMIHSVAKLVPRAWFLWDQAQEVKGAALFGTARPTKDLRLVWRELAYDARDTILLTGNFAPRPPQSFNVLPVSRYDPTEKADYCMLKLIQYLDRLRHQSNVASFMKATPFEETADWPIVPDPNIAHLKYSKIGQILVDPPAKKAKKKAEGPVSKKTSSASNDFLPIKDSPEQSEAAQKLKRQEKLWLDRVREIEVAERGGAQKRPASPDRPSADRRMPSGECPSEIKKIAWRDVYKRREERREDWRRRDGDGIQKTHPKKVERDQDKRGRKVRKLDETSRKCVEETYERKHLQAPIVSKEELDAIVTRFTLSISAEIAAWDAMKK